MRMLFFHKGGESGTTESFLRVWRSGSPGVSVSPHDVYTCAQGGISRKLLALPRALRRGGLGVLRRGQGRFGDALRRSAWLNRSMSKVARRIHAQERAECSLSLGTTFDGSTPGRPHFIYTDLTILANLYYPDGARAVREWAEWLPFEIDIIHRARLLFTRSEHVTRSLRDQYGVPPEKIVCVRAGCNVRPPVEVDPHRFERQEVLFVGVEWERKGGPQLVEAFRQVRRRYPRARLTVVGCKPGIIEPGVELAGSVPPSRVSDFLGQASVFCLPSRREAFGHAYLEAMQAGLPVIATNLGAAPDFILDGETGYRIEPDDIAGLAGRMEELLGDPDHCRQMGERGRHLVSASYTWEQTQRDMAQSIAQALRI